jgi:radical SAM superfamily enzyme YgiQ (UPF0313 family)
MRNPIPSGSARPGDAPFLPRTRAEVARRGWDALDVLLVTGDGYVDHPSFGVAAIGRLLEARGYRVGVLDVPELEPDGSGWKRLPTPRLYVGVSAGTIDSMVTNYTAAKKPRRSDVYRPGGKVGRPNRATIAYTALARHHFPGVPVIVGGLEAGPRRLAHYDYWQDQLRRSILIDSKADLLVWGMGERQSLEVARRLEAGESLSGMGSTCEVVRADELPPDARKVPSYEELLADRQLEIELFNAVREENHPGARVLAQAHGPRYVLQYPPLPPSTQAEVDSYYDLPFRRESHPDHDAAGGIPALEPVRWSVNTHRGCMADCTFCSITFHQGRTIQGRSEESILREAAALAHHHDFRGTITDVGGPTANMWGLGCKLLEKGDPCLGRDCLTPNTCPGAAHRQDLGGLPPPARAGAADAGREARLRELGHPPRPLARQGRRAPAAAPRPGEAPRQRAHEARARARLARHAARDEQALLRRVRGLRGRLPGGLRRARQGPAPRELLHRRPPGHDHEGRGVPVREAARAQLLARAGAGVHPAADDARLRAVRDRAATR